MQNITNGRIQVTENDLKLINYELEKFLEAESKEEGSDESSARISNVSTITLGGKQMEGADEEDYWKTGVCPLQGYLFGSSIELPETRTEPKKEKASLAELFHRTKITTEGCTEKCASEEIPDKHKHKSAMHYMKKMIKKLHPSSKSSPHSASGDLPDSISTKKELGNAIDSVSSKKKLHKVGLTNYISILILNLEVRCVSRYSISILILNLEVRCVSRYSEIKYNWVEFTFDV